ncbi:hypothetical protein ACOAKC_11920 [Hathewaya histolytica]|uniref:hypothetical protein n=1 Tax=Hathewaya histolytica TaxID=1498 RepID=UPI003B67749F
MSAGVIIGIVLLVLIGVVVVTGMKEQKPFEDLDNDDIKKLEFIRMDESKVASKKQEVISITKYLKTIVTKRIDDCKLTGPVYSIKIITETEKEIDIGFFYTKFHYKVTNIKTGQLEKDQWYKNSDEVVKQLQRLYFYVL